MEGKRIKNKLLRMIVAIAFVVCFMPMSAGDNSDKLMIGSGLWYENGWDATVAYEHEGAYHNTWEAYVNGYVKWRRCESCGHICSQSLFHNYRTWEVGLAWKPCVNRAKNMNGHWRLGAGVGSNTKKVIGSLSAGYEHDYSLKSGWQLYWQVGVKYVLRGKDQFRTGVSIGIKLPL